MPTILSRVVQFPTDAFASSITNEPNQTIFLISIEAFDGVV